MPSAELSIRYSKNSSLIMSPEDLKGRYLFGIPLEDSDGNKIPDENINFYIEAAQKEVENYLSIKFNKQAYKESGDFQYNNWVEWGFIPTMYPVHEPVSLQGFLNSSLQIDFPAGWLSHKTQSADKDLYHRQMSLVPLTGTVNSLSNSVVYTGISPHIGYFGGSHIPNYWEITYITGFDTPPADLINIVGKLASINLFHILGDLIVGAGIASKSISADGLSQTINTTSSATNSGYGARVLAYTKEIEKALALAKARYTGITFATA